MKRAPIKISVVRPEELNSRELARWTRFCQETPELASPYFRPQFALAVANTRGDVRVAILEQDGEIVGFFPFQRGALGIGKPVGGHMSDYHGVVGRPDMVFDPVELVHGCKLNSWDFDHVPANQRSFAPGVQATASSPYLDLSQGFDTYLKRRCTSKSSTVRQVLRRARRLVREVGEYEYVRHVDDPHVLHKLLDWKIAQYARTKIPNVLQMTWTRKLLEEVLCCQDNSFQGQLSVLYVQGKIAAIDLMLRADHVLHSWFGHFDQELAKYSPGHILLLKMAEDAQSNGIGYIDLGKGAGYKLHFMTDAFPLLEGHISCHRGHEALRRICRSSAAIIRSSPLRPTARMLGTLARPLRNWVAFR